MVTNYNWETNWFGNFYLPWNSQLITNGSTSANLLGLYHFTTQTNQIAEGTKIVDIGYHYVATDPNGNPLVPLAMALQIILPIPMVMALTTRTKHHGTLQFCRSPKT